MNREDIIRMAREAGFEVYETDVWITDGWWLEELERFATIIAAAEREACAKFIENDYVRQFERPWRDDLSAAIRARGDK